MTNLQLLESLIEAHKILETAHKKLASGPNAIWRKAFHAAKYLDSQIADLLTEEHHIIIERLTPCTKDGQ